MKRKIVYGITGGAILLVIGLVLGFLAGAYIGGNYFTRFEFGGVRGYEAVGNIGAMLGAGMGALLGVILGVRLASRK
jgi:hypothetical protein